VARRILMAPMLPYLSYAKCRDDYRRKMMQSSWFMYLSVCLFVYKNWWTDFE